MPDVDEILDSHPHRVMGAEDLVDCVRHCFSCAQVCTACADACLGEREVQRLQRCIRINLDCADICDATGRMLLRQSEPDVQIVRAMLEACVTAVLVCAAECERHADAHAHCRVCAEACRQCAEACQELIETYGGS